MCGLTGFLDPAKLIIIYAPTPYIVLTCQCNCAYLCICFFFFCELARPTCLTCPQSHSIRFTCTLIHHGIQFMLSVYVPYPCLSLYWTTYNIACNGHYFGLCRLQIALNVPSPLQSEPNVSLAYNGLHVQILYQHCVHICHLSYS